MPYIVVGNHLEDAGSWESLYEVEGLPTDDQGRSPR